MQIGAKRGKLCGRCGSGMGKCLQLMPNTGKCTAGTNASAGKCAAGTKCGKMFAASIHRRKTCKWGNIKNYRITFSRCGSAGKRVGMRENVASMLCTGKHVTSIKYEKIFNWSYTCGTGVNC